MQAPGLKRRPQRLARAEQVTLAYDFVQAARAQALGQRHVDVRRISRAFARSAIGFTKIVEQGCGHGDANCAADRAAATNRRQLMR